MENYNGGFFMDMQQHINLMDAQTLYTAIHVGGAALVLGLIFGFSFAKALRG